MTGVDSSERGFESSTGDDSVPEHAEPSEDGEHNDSEVLIVVSSSR